MTKSSSPGGFLQKDMRLTAEGRKRRIERGRQILTLSEMGVVVLISHKRVFLLEMIPDGQKQHTTKNEEVNNRG